MNTALVIDDHPVTHLGCHPLLVEAGFNSILEARNCEEGYQHATSHHPQFIILDLGLPGIGGLAMISRLLVKTPDSKILVFSMHDDPIFAARALEAGAHGYLTKSTKPEELITAVSAIREGNIYIEHGIATQLAVLHSRQGENPFADLSARELQILRLIGAGHHHSEIADQLNLSYKTVANNCSALKSKLGAKRLPDLMRIAIEHDKYIPSTSPLSSSSC
ncbi:MAG: response regulator transcription factor [Granulosicoccus sp.]